MFPMQLPSLLFPLQINPKYVWLALGKLVPGVLYIQFVLTNEGEYNFLAVTECQRSPCIVSIIIPTVMPHLSNRSLYNIINASFE